MFVCSANTLSLADTAFIQENPQHTLYFAYFFFVDHILSTVWTVFFTIVWWNYPHDGQQISNSLAQEAIRHGAPDVKHSMTDAQRAVEANILWHEEKSTAMGVIIVSWLAKVRSWPKSCTPCHVLIS